MADVTNVKNLIVNADGRSYSLNMDGVHAELGITKERFAELLARDFYCPVISDAPTESTLTYIDTDGSENHFVFGQECRVPDIESQDYQVFKFMGTYQGKAVWVKLARQVLDLENDAEYVTEEYVKNAINNGDGGEDDDNPDNPTPSDGQTTTIQVNQGITDPATMITRTVDEGGIEAIRANSHRYTGKLNADGIMELKQLNDVDGTKYIDGSTAELTTLGVDVWMKLPEFYWKCINLTDDLIEISFQYGGSMKEGWKHWDGKEMIGVYKTSTSSGKLYSVSGANYEKTTFFEKRNSARARGKGYSIIKWKHHCMMAMLFCAQYNHTNSQELIGTGTSSSIVATGQTDLLGMEDTVASINGNSQPVNFWGLESWWGNLEEFIDDISVSGSMWSALEDDGSIRFIGTGPSSAGFISKMLFGERMDLLPVELSGSGTSGFCDNLQILSTYNRVVRSNFSTGTSAGIFGMLSGINSGATNCGTRLVFRGDYVTV